MENKDNNQGKLNHEIYLPDMLGGNGMQIAPTNSIKKLYELNPDSNKYYDANLSLNGLDITII